MSLLPSAIVFINNDLTPNVEAMLVRQLFISQVVDGYTFDNNIISNDYLPSLKQNNKRLMVVRSFLEPQNRELADIVLFCKMGLAAVEINKFGPHGFTLPITKLYWGILGIY